MVMAASGGVGVAPPATAVGEKGGRAMAEGLEAVAKEGRRRDESCFFKVACDKRGYA